jgi:hypothetical protein
MRRLRVSGFAGFSRRAAVPSIDPACPHGATQAQPEGKDRAMEPRQQWKQELRGASFVIAVVIALMGFSAALATREQPKAAPADAPSAASAYQDPSLSGLRVAEDAEVDTTVELHN